MKPSLRRLHSRSVPQQPDTQPWHAEVRCAEVAITEDQAMRILDYVARWLCLVM